VQKIVPDARGRHPPAWREYALPIEDKKWKDRGAPGSFIGKLLIFEARSRR